MYQDQPKKTGQKKRKLNILTNTSPSFLFSSKLYHDQHYDNDVQYLIAHLNVLVLRPKHHLNLEVQQGKAFQM